MPDKKSDESGSTPQPEPVPEPKPSLALQSADAYAPPVPKHWTAVTITADAELADSIGAFLIDHGAPGLVTDDVAAGVRITAHFEQDAPRPEIERFCGRLREWFPDSAPVQVAFATTTEENWADNWKAHFPPLTIGDRLWVHPPWISEIPPGRVGVVIDPGMAFGTGHHASTRGCLTFLEQNIRPSAAPRVLDIGTGSGVLAIAAAKLGAREAWGVDIDADACAIANLNAATNSVGAYVHICADPALVPGAFDVVVANLFADQLVDMARMIRDRVVAGGLVIGAGILTVEAARVEHAWKALGIMVHARIEEGEWTTILAQRDGG